VEAQGTGAVKTLPQQGTKTGPCFPAITGPASFVLPSACTLYVHTVVVSGPVFVEDVL
jgi:hypothetical protein